MKILHLVIISICLIVSAAMFLPQSFANEWGPLPSSYPENKTMMLSFTYLPKGQSANGTEGSIHIKLFDARTGLPIKDTSFWMNVKRGDSQVMNSRFYTYSGNLTLNLQHGSDYQWTEAPDHDPIFIGGFESKNDVMNVDVQPLAKDVLYYFEIDLATYDEPKMVLFEPSGIKFDTSVNSTIPYNQTISSSTFAMTPLDQFKSGIPASDVKCNDGLQLLIKAEDGSPTCANLDTANALVERGWARDESAQPDGSTHYTAETNSTIIPGDLPRGSCGVMLPYYTTSRIINYTGFAGAYPEQFMFHGTINDYVLVPGHHAAMTYEIDAGLSHGQSTMNQVAAPAYLNMTNYAIFYHEITSLEDLARYPGVTIDGNQDFNACFTRPTGQDSCIGGMPNGQGPIEDYVTGHQGVDVLFEPPAEMLQLGASQEGTSKIVTLTITADKDTPRGTYLTVLDSECGGITFLLTIGEQPYHE